MTGIEELAAAAASAIGEAATSSTVLSAAGAAAATAGISALTAPKAPGVKAPVAMPGQQAIDDARRRSLADQMMRRGRASTILTDRDDTLG
jgi:hypothetical protein